MCRMPLTPAIEQRHPVRVDIEALDAETGIEGGQHQRNADIAEADDADDMAAPVDRREGVVKPGAGPWSVTVVMHVMSRL